MARPRILQLISGFSVGDQMGGAEQFGLQLARHLNKAKFETIVCGVWYYETPSERKWIKILQDEGIQNMCLARPSGSLANDFGRAVHQFWSLVSLLRPAIINSHSEHSDVLNTLIRMFHPVAVKSVRTMHTDQQWQDRPWVGKLLIETVFPFVFDAEIAISKSTQAVLDRRRLAAMLQKQAVLTYNGIDENLKHRRLMPLRRRPLGARYINGTRHIAIIGRLEQQKGHVYLLEAVKQLVPELSVHLHIIGTGSLEQRLQQQAVRLGIMDIVHFIGSRDDVFDLLPQFDVVVSSSLWEGFPTVLLEAMTLGVPVIATDVSGSHELVIHGKTGLLVPPADALQLADAIRYMLGNFDQALIMADAATKHVSTFTIQEAAVSYEQLYTRITM